MNDGINVETELRLVYEVMMECIPLFRTHTPDRTYFSVNIVSLSELTYFEKWTVYIPYSKTPNFDTDHTP